MEKKEDMTNAIKLTFKDNIIISNNNGSKPKINFTEFKIISRIFMNKLFMQFYVTFLR